ncbi:hypothetical protein X770_14180 [Mesorhizobium sp. LSJC269B00]|uniref:hypothetical protein n=1 Tax=Mesorhizobium sp. LSJC269B00 TaxID=1287326 RepID=UPI0003CF9659|nr:hypothetical protein [Mesorhizobium sp. LSJC269B00]ESW89770.1 hypothetical protein X770_14180 [Mesorhizobium sp. LSJC269B00]
MRLFAGLAALLAIGRASGAVVAAARLHSLGLGDRGAAPDAKRNHARDQHMFHLLSP